MTNSKNCDNQVLDTLKRYNLTKFHVSSTYSRLIFHVFFTICVHLRVLYSLIILFWFSEIYISTIIVNLYSTGISSFQTKPVISVRFTKDLSYAYHRFPYHSLLKVFFFNRNLAGFPYVAITRKFVTFSIARQRSSFAFLIYLIFINKQTDALIRTNSK